MRGAQIKKALLEEYPYRIELHAHTRPASSCSEISPEEMVKIYSDKGYDAVIITNHFYKDVDEDISYKNAYIDRYVSDYEKAAEAAKKYNIRVFLGAEIRFTENHNDYLLFGVDKELLSICYDYLDRGIKKFRNEVVLESSVFLQAHPFRNGMELVDPALLDGIETFNMHPNHNSRVGQAARYACDSNLKIKIAGSDFHHKNQGHEALSALRCRTMPSDSFDIAKILKSGDFILELGEDSILLP